jgi:hypothetical protein
LLTSIGVAACDTCLIREAADDHNRRRIGLGYDRLPRDRQDELAGAGDDDGSAERRADSEVAHEGEALAARRLEDVRNEGRRKLEDRLPKPREVVEGELSSFGDVKPWGVDGEELEAVLTNPPEHPVVRAERHPRLSADGSVDVARVVKESRGDLEDAVESTP